MAPDPFDRCDAFVAGLSSPGEPVVVETSFAGEGSDPAAEYRKAALTPVASFTDPARGRYRWVGAGGEPERYGHAAPAERPRIVSFYTDDRLYRASAAKLTASLAAQGIEDAVIHKVPPFASWQEACAHKARFLRAMLREQGRPVLWVDADAQVQGDLGDIPWPQFDFGIHLQNGWQMGSGTVYLNTTPAAMALVEAWLRLCETRPMVWDQMCLQEAYWACRAAHPMATLYLPQRYLKIEGQDWSDAATERRPVIAHELASKRAFRRGQTRQTPAIPYDFIAETRKDRPAIGARVDMPAERPVVASDGVPRRHWPALETDYARLLAHLFACAERDGRLVSVVIVGAMDGRRFDALYPYLSKGLARAILVEPIPDRFELLKANFPNHPHLTFENCAIDAEAGEREMLYIPVDAVEKAGLPEDVIGMSSFYDDRNGLGGVGGIETKPALLEKVMASRKSIRVPTRPLADVVAGHGVEQVDILQIDTEGHDLHVLKSFDMDRIRPEVIFMEYFNLPRAERIELIDRFEAHGYIYGDAKQDVCATLCRLPARPDTPLQRRMRKLQRSFDKRFGRG